MLKVFCFTSTWCGPCKTMKPIIKDIADSNTDKFEFVFVDIEEDQETAQFYGIRGVPTYVIVKEDKEVGRIVGSMSKDKVIDTLNSHV